MFQFINPRLLYEAWHVSETQLLSVQPTSTSRLYPRSGMHMGTGFNPRFYENVDKESVKSITKWVQILVEDAVGL